MLLKKIVKSYYIYWYLHITIPICLCTFSCRDCCVSHIIPLYSCLGCIVTNQSKQQTALRNDIEQSNLVQISDIIFCYFSITVFLYEAGLENRSSSPISHASDRNRLDPFCSIELKSLQLFRWLSEFCYYVTNRGWWFFSCLMWVIGVIWIPIVLSEKLST